MRADVLAGKESLHAVIQVLVQRDLGDGRIDRHLELRPVELLQRLLDHAIAFLIGVDEQGVVDRVRRDAHARQDRALAGLPAASERAAAEPGTRAGSDARASERSAAARHDIVRAAGLRGDRRAGRRAAQPRIRRRPARLHARAADAQAALLRDVAGAGQQARTRRDLIGGAVDRPAGAATPEDIGQQLRHLARIAVAHLIDLHARACGVGLVEAGDPGRGGLQQRRLRADHHDGIEPGDRLQLDQSLAHAAFAQVHDALEFAHHRLRRRVAHRIDADRLAAHPVGIEAQHGLGGVAPVRPAALDQHEIARGLDAHAARLRGETVEQFAERRGRHVLQRDDRHAVARLAARRGVNAAAADRFGGGEDDVAALVAHQRRAAQPQGAFEDEQQVALRHRPPRGERNRALHARIDDVADAKDVAEHDLGDTGDRRILEIQLIPVAARRGLRADHAGQVGPGARLAEIGRGRHAARAAGRDSARRLRKARQQIDRAHLVEDIGLAALIFIVEDVAGGGDERHQAKQRDEPSARYGSKSPLRPTDVTHRPTRIIMRGYSSLTLCNITQSRTRAN